MKDTAPAPLRATLQRLAGPLLVFAAVGLLLRLVSVFNPVSFDYDRGDEATYVLIAQSMLEGHLPYTEAFDHKPIALYYLFAAMLAVFGDGNYGAIRLMPLMAIAASAWLVYRAMAPRWPAERRQWLAPVIVFMLSCTSFGNGGHVGNTEILQMPFIAAWWHTALVLRPGGWQRAVLLGIWTGIITQINYLGGLAMALCTAMMLVWPLLSGWSAVKLREFLTAGLCALSGFAAMVLLTLLPLITAGMLDQYFSLQAALMGGYAGRLNADKWLRAGVSIAASASFFLVLLACGVRRRGWRSVVPEECGTLFVQLLAASALTLVPIVMTQRLYPHYFNLLVVPSTLLFLLLLGRADAQVLRRATLPVLLLAVGLIGRGAWDVYFKDWHDGFRNQSDVKAMARFVKEHAGGRQKALLLDVDQTVYVLAGAAPASKFFFRGVIFFEPLMARLHSSPQQEIVKALDRKPAVVLACLDRLDGPVPALLASHMAGSYREVAYAGNSLCRDLKAFVLLAKTPASS